MLNTHNNHAGQRRASDSYTDFLAFSNPTGVQNVSCLERYGRDVCTKSFDWYGLGTFNPQLSVSIYNK